MKSLFEIYIPLLDGGVECHRPAIAEHIDGYFFRILEPEDYDPEDEKWAFTPGERVRCKICYGDKNVGRLNIKRTSILPEEMPRILLHPILLACERMQNSEQGSKRGPDHDPA